MMCVFFLSWISIVNAIAPKDFSREGDVMSTTHLTKSMFKDEWEMYMYAFNKEYNSKEVASRKEEYLTTRDWINQHNQKYLDGKVSYKLSLNEFSDMSLDEAMTQKTGFLETLDNLDEYQQHIQVEEQEEELLMSNTLPTEVNWANLKGAPPIKDQGNCGSCWAFSALTAMEYQLAKRNCNYPYLSEQQLIDCSKAEGNMGCSGGLMSKAYNYIMKNSGVTSNNSYVYTEAEGKCNTAVKNVVKLNSYKRMDKTTESAVMRVLATHGPVCAAMDASSSNIYGYSGGVYEDCYCNNTKVNHGVIIIGYGTQDSTDYWLVHNSWGTQWGENGYLKISRYENLCGLMNLVSYPIL